MRTTRARYELIKGTDAPENNGDQANPDNRCTWLDWLADSNPAHRDEAGAPLIQSIAKDANVPYKTLWALANGRTPTLETLGDIVAAGMYLHGVSEDVAKQHIVRLVHRPDMQAEAA